MRTHSRLAAITGSLVLAGALAACAEQPRYSDYQAPPSPGHATYPAAGQPHGTEYGTVSHIEGIHARNRSSGAGAVIGAVVGGVLGNQIGGGSGRAAATVLGAVGGGVAGNAVEGRMNDNGGPIEGYRLSISLDQGGQRVYEVSSPGDLRPGDRVRLNGGQISRL